MDSLLSYFLSKQLYDFFHHHMKARGMVRVSGFINCGKVCFG